MKPYTIKETLEALRFIREALGTNIHVPERSRSELPRIDHEHGPDVPAIFYAISHLRKLRRLANLVKVFYKAVDCVPDNERVMFNPGVVQAFALMVSEAGVHEEEEL